MTRIVLLLSLISGCVAHEAEKPDAGALPSCSDVCPGESGLCKRDGQCSCPEPDGEIVECQRAAPPDAASSDATEDAP